MSSPRVFIIILNWNGMKDTVECLESVCKLDYDNYDIIVVDNGSIDNPTQLIKEKYPRVITLCNEKNMGYAGGNNVGIKYALKHAAEYIWLLNNDTIVKKDSLANLVMAAEKDHNIGITGSKIFYYDTPDILWFAGARIDWSQGVSEHYGIGEKDCGQYDSIREVDRVTGCSMLIKKDVCYKIGLLDEEYFIYVEEVDLCVRARKAGYKCMYIPSSIIYHKESAAVLNIGNREKIFNYYNTRNFLYLISKTFSFPKREILLLKVILGKLRKEKTTILKILACSKRKSHKIMPIDAPIIYAIYDFMRNKMRNTEYVFK